MSSSVLCQAIGQTVATLSERITSQAIKQGSSGEIVDAAILAGAVAMPPVMILAGLMSKAFTESGQDTHPGKCATEDSILFACLVLARAARPGGGGLGISFNPEIYADAITDFGKLKPLTSVDSFLRADLLSIIPDIGDGSALLSGILSKRLN